MKRLCAVLLLCCLLFGSCGADADFVISRESTASSQTNDCDGTEMLVLINKNSGKYHLDPDCVYASRMSEENRLEIKVKNEEYLLSKGYTPCAKCSSKK